MDTKAVLLDIGNVVLGVDFLGVLAAWSSFAGVPVTQLKDRFELDEAYSQYERNEIPFAAYTQHLNNVLGIDLTDREWQDGWNQVWTQPFSEVVALLPDLRNRMPLYAFSNTNQVHATHFRAHYADEISAFITVFCSNEIGLRKPEIEAYLNVCQRMDVRPENVLFLDDNEENIEGALVAGLDAHLCKSEAAVVSHLAPLLN